ncbi:MAG TPA: hypothetical protein VJR89_23660, partial [Polyangiales bacterium]|nr:hypothetical protein [Polyangiales bacterium]
MRASDAMPLPAQRTERKPLSIHGALPRGERVVEWVLACCGALTVFTTFGILAVLAIESFAFFRSVGVWALIADTQWTPLFADK